MVLKRHGFILMTNATMFRFCYREPKAKYVIAKPIPATNGPKSHERRFDFGHVSEFQHDDGDDGNEQLFVSVHDAELLQPARRSSGQRRRVVDVKYGSFAGRQRIPHAISLLQRDSSESDDTRRHNTYFMYI